MRSVAIYTTIYPDAYRYFADFFGSLNRQDCREFDLWIGVDGILDERFSGLICSDIAVRFIRSADGENPISLRNRALSEIASKYDIIVCVDSDDILVPTRVSAALLGIEGADVHGCALGLIDMVGNDLGIYFGLHGGESPDEVVPYNNFLGLSNTTWRSDMLRKCLPVPASCIAMDWLLATRAWFYGARISFDRTIRMRYRQNGTNTACVVPPFSAQQIIRATAVVTEHYRLLLMDDPAISTSQRQKLHEAASRSEKFRYAISSFPAILNEYVSALNQLPPHRLWWLSVAHPALEKIWNR